MPLRKAVNTSSWWIGQFKCVASAIRIRIVSHLTTGAKMSKKSTSSFCSKPRATNLVLYLGGLPLLFLFTLKNHFEEMAFLWGGSWTRVQVLLLRMESISTCMAALQRGLLCTCWKVSSGSSSGREFGDSSSTWAAKSWRWRGKQRMWSDLRGKLFSKHGGLPNLLVF